MGAILRTIERRIRANVLYMAVLNFQHALPVVEAINCITHVTQPTLVLRGELDFFLPVETSQEPMFDLLGTPHEHRLPSCSRTIDPRSPPRLIRYMGFDPVDVGSPRIARHT